MQPFLLFFIDGASFIDEDDAKWELLLAVEEHAGQDVVVSSSAFHWQSALECMHAPLLSDADQAKGYL